MPFSNEEIANWHKERREHSAKIEAERSRNIDRARRASAAAICIHCGNPFGLAEGIITDEVEMCYICLD